MLILALTIFCYQMFDTYSLKRGNGNHSLCSLKSIIFGVQFVYLMRDNNNKTISHSSFGELTLLLVPPINPLVGWKRFKPCCSAHSHTGKKFNTECTTWYCVYNEVNNCRAECEVFMKLCHLQFHYYKRHTTSSSPTVLIHPVLVHTLFC